MATDSSMPAAASSRSGGGGASADSYIGSLISLTSKSEIRYEGILYNINTEESSIGLCNVRSFGTEGRKKDGPQVPPSDKIYEYILFRGSDIKDLQVKASPPVQSTPPINNDPAIIQSQFPHHTTPPASLPTAPGSSLTDHSAHSGLPGSNFQSGLPLYQPGGNLNSWGPSPPNANGSGLAMPMYWQGFYGPPNGLPQLPQQSLLRTPPGLSIPPSMQHMQFSGFNSSLPTLGSGLPTSNLPDYHSSLVPNTSSSSSLASTSLPASNSSLNLPPIQPLSFMSEAMNNLLPHKDPIAAISTSPPSNSMPSMSHLPSKDAIAPISTSAPSSNLPSLSHPPNSMPENLGAPLVASKPSAIPSTAALPLQTLSRHGTSVSGASPILTETPTPSLITPGHLLHSGPATGHTSQTMQTARKDVEVVQVSSNRPPETSAPVVTEAQPPLLPLPQYSRAQKPNGGSSYYTRNNYHHYRGRGGRGSSRVSRPVTKFTEDFDFTAMNEKFNKDEVWGHLGKSSKSPGKDEGNASGSDENDSQGDDSEMPKHDAKPVYKKDDFFDSLSCNALDNDPNHGRTRYSEQMKLDSETFGEISRYRGGRGHGPGRGGGRFRGSYHGRGYGGGYGYSSRGRGRGIQNRAREPHM